MPTWLSDAMQDLRYAARLLRKSPGFALTAAVMLALGIGANTAVFSIIDGTLLRPLPYRAPEQLVAIWDHSVRESALAKIFASYNDFVQFREHARSFEQQAAATWATGTHPILTGHGPGRTVMAVPVSAGFFDLLGVAPALGRTFTANDAAKGCSVVLAHSFWNSPLGADPRIIGQTLNLDRRPCTVLGIMPPGFSFYPTAAAMWSVITPDFVPAPDKLIVGIFGRLKPGVSAQAAQAELVALHQSLHRADGQERDIAPEVFELQSEFTWLAGRNLRTTLWLLLGAVGMVLLIACSNVAILLLGRSFTRSRELAVRAALGGGRSPLLRQLLTESLLLSALGAALGVAAAVIALRSFRALNPVEMPVGAVVSISRPVLFFTLALACLTSLLFGLAPAWKSSSVSLSDAFKRGGRSLLTGYGGARLSKALIAGEVALSVVLLAGAALLIESVARLGSTPLGFQPDGVVSAGLSLPEKAYADPERRLHLYKEIASNVTALPGVADAALASSLPPYGNASQSLEVFGRPLAGDAAVHDVVDLTVTPGYFRTLGVQLLRGRLFTEHDRVDTERVALVDAALAKEYFGDGDPIGRRVRIRNDREPNRWATVVGVVATERRVIVYQEMNWIEPPTLFRPLAQHPGRSVSLVVRAAGTPGIREAIGRLDSDIAVGGLEPLRQKITAFLAYPRFRALVLGAFAAIALMLAAMGLHGVIAQFIAQRTHEIGLRLALGARPAHVTTLVARHGGMPVLIGLAIGLASAMTLGRLLAGLLYGVQPHDPITLTAVSLALVVAALVAIAVPARRAARTDPMVTLGAD
jgi:predicted permease